MRWRGGSSFIWRSRSPAPLGEHALLRRTPLAPHLRPVRVAALHPREPREAGRERHSASNVATSNHGRIQCESACLADLARLRPQHALLRRAPLAARARPLRPAAARAGEARAVPEVRVLHGRVGGVQRVRSGAAEPNGGRHDVRIDSCRRGRATLCDKSVATSPVPSATLGTISMSFSVADFRFFRCALFFMILHGHGGIYAFRSMSC